MCTGHIHPQSLCLFTIKPYVFMLTHHCAVLAFDVVWLPAFLPCQQHQHAAFAVGSWASTLLLSVPAAVLQAQSNSFAQTIQRRQLMLKLTAQTERHRQLPHAS